MDDLNTDVNADSSSASEPADPSSQATSQPVQPAAPERQIPFHQHPRWIERENTWKAREAALNGQLAQVTQRLQQLERRSQSPAASPEEQEQYTQAAAALKKIIAADPDLAGLMEMQKHLPQLTQGYQSVAQLQQAQARAQTSSARSYIGELVEAEGLDLPTDATKRGKAMQHLTRLVAGAAMAIPDGEQRYAAGDMSVLDEAWSDVKDSILASMRRAATNTVAQTKAKLRTLPPGPRGGPAGPAAPAKLEPGKEREFEQGMHSRAKQMLEGLLGG